MSKPDYVRSAGSEDAMVALGAELGKWLRGPVTVFLCGDLGMGKTTFARGILHSFGHNGAVKSPTYTLVEPYELEQVTLYHFDLYRLGDPEELEFMGIRDYFSENSVCLVEWPERGLGVLPAPDIVIDIQVEGLGRRVSLSGESARGRSVLVRLQH